MDLFDCLENREEMNEKEENRERKTVFGWNYGRK